jgi:hypothetical protein
MSNILSIEKQTRAIHALGGGSSIRSIERMMAAGVSQTIWKVADLVELAR